jgi:hypothetical protein
MTFPSNEHQPQTERDHAVEAYLEGGGGKIDMAQIALLRAYLRQWINAPGWDANPHADDDDRAELAELRARVDQLMSRTAIDRWIEKAGAEGLDPL